MNRIIGHGSSLDNRCGRPYISFHYREISIRSSLTHGHGIVISIDLQGTGLSQGVFFSRLLAVGYPDLCFSVAVFVKKKKNLPGFEPATFVSKDRQLLLYLLTTELNFTSLRYLECRASALGLLVSNTTGFSCHQSRMTKIHYQLVCIHPSGRGFEDGQPLLPQY